MQNIHMDQELKILMAECVFLKNKISEQVKEICSKVSCNKVLSENNTDNKEENEEPRKLQN